jgi:hypothetical protein
MEKEYKLNSIVKMKKPHPCGSNEWTITRMGVDIKIYSRKEKWRGSKARNKKRRKNSRHYNDD